MSLLTLAAAHPFAPFWIFCFLIVPIADLLPENRE
jgi:hypothetical protein